MPPQQRDLLVPQLRPARTLDSPALVPRQTTVLTVTLLRISTAQHYGPEGSGPTRPNKHPKNCRSQECSLKDLRRMRV